MIKKSLLTLSFLLILSPAIFALTTDEVMNASSLQKYKDKLMESKQEIIKEHKEVKEQVVERVCEVLEEKIENRISRFDTYKDMHIEKYRKLKGKLQEIVELLGDKGFDVAKLKEDLAELDSMIVEYAKAYDDFIESLRVTKEYACGKSEGEFKDALNEAREKLLIVRKLRMEIRSFYHEVIREDIKDLREQASEMYEVEGEE